ncbi:HAD hydrolase family protein [Campylobacter sp. FMV-PI01]|uniref:HAD hydrolase family protein n=1 Tax=Campylobacter portucalensis TaxID=2608384 RepID=A0A6L5WJ35_9BACT|nr:HAD hydrolase family protein [Campylobacter portucalensis]MSN96015.1 HAD hydrolase family protein [Campylobacter portucalensis]
MIEIIFLDVDGCLSDGGIYYSNLGDELKKFNAKDGFGIMNWHKIGKISAIITGRKSKIVENRAEELGIKYVYQGANDKFSIAQDILKKENLSFENAAAIGDDYNDIKLLNAVKMSFAPLDALIKSDFKLSKKGGDGAVREMIETIVEKENLRDVWLQGWL